MIAMSECLDVSDFVARSCKRVHGMPAGVPRMLRNAPPLGGVVRC
ncbi:hypothetical protein ACVWZZ_002877 [Bradyrhizobium sp. LM6.10]|jgi:hypothetical protein